MIDAGVFMDKNGVVMFFKTGSLSSKRDARIEVLVRFQACLQGF